MSFAKHRVALVVLLLASACASSTTPSNRTRPSRRNTFTGPGPEYIKGFPVDQQARQPEGDRDDLFERQARSDDLERDMERERERERELEMQQNLNAPERSDPSVSDCPSCR